MKRKGQIFLGVAIVLSLAGFALGPRLRAHARSVGLLRSMASENRDATPGFGREVVGLKLSGGRVIPAREYGLARDKASCRIVIGHGIHHLGISEPRLRRFAEHVAAQGCYVLTPELTELAAYRITAEGAEVLRAAVRFASDDGERVGLVGFSFAGGMALLAAMTPEVSGHLNYVASIGGYQDLARTLRFLASHEVETPNGKLARHAHEYGMLVLLNEHLEHFSLGDDQDTFRAALVGWLKEDRKTARAAAKELKTEWGRHLFQLIEKQQLSELRPKILELLEGKKSTLAALSPAGRLSMIHTRVLLLHGTADTVVPSEEAEFGALELEKAEHAHLALVTPLLEHVSVDHPATARQKWELVHFMAQLF